MNENKAVPNIRFNDFENKWEKKKLNQIVKKVTRKNSKLQTSLSLTISAERGIINQNLFFNRQIASRDMSNYFLIKQGEFAYNKSYSKSAPFGTIKRLNRYNQGALSSLYIVFCPTKVNSDYLVSYFDSSYWYKQLSMISTEGVRNHGLLNVSPNDFFDMNLSIPYDDKEQQEIGDFFIMLDKLLDLQQQKIDKLELLKKALLQKLFPKHDAKIPELRFKGYKEDWRDKKTLELVSERNSKIIPNDDYPLKAFVARKGITEKGKKYNRSFLVKSRQKKYKKTEYGDLIYSSNNLEVGSIGINRYGNACVSPVYSIFKVNDSLAYDFLGYLIQRKEFIFNMVRYRQGVTYGQWKIHESDFLNIQVSVPETLSEQKKIGNLLSEVDQLIELENKKLQNLQQAKKCLLQNMFVE